MSSKLNYIIPQANFELIRDRIGTILLEELDNQAVLQNDADATAEIYAERFTPVSKEEGNVIIVSINRMQLDQQTPVSQRNSVTYDIDIYTNSIQTEDIEGYYSSSIKLQRLAGMVRHILQSPYYDRLGFANGIVERRSVGAIDFDKGGDNQDASYSRMCRVSLSVSMNENQNGIPVIEGVSYETQVKLSTTEKGYKFIKEN